MVTATANENFAVALKKEIMLQVNQELFDQNIISKEVYEQAKIKIVSI